MCNSRKALYTRQCFCVTLKKSGTCGLRMYYLTVIEGQASKSLLGTPRVCINNSFFVYFHGHHKTFLKNSERIYSIDISLSQEIKFLDISV